ncbi:ABC transporter protein [Streptococcus dysgalactiae subsp. dysgalactiae ATCC 27957]|nr:ABC transporter protein [Streptococcus dysgalactiae subsp. dysgalactiae ATCC 27957]
MNIKEFFRNIPKVKAILLFIFMLISGFDGVVMAQVISSVTKFNSSYKTQDIFHLLIYGILAYVVVHIASMLVDFLNNNILKSLNQKYKLLVIESIFSSRKPNKDVGDVLTLLTVDLKVIEEKYFAVILGSVYYLLMGGISLLYLIYLSPIVSLLFIIFSLLPALPSILFSRILEEATDNNIDKNNVFIKNIKDFTKGFPVIFTYDAYMTFLGRSRGVLKDMEESSEQMRDKNSVVDFFTAILSWLSYLIPISIALLFVIKGQLESSVVIALFLASDRVITPFRNFSEYLSMLKSTGSIREKIGNIISQKDINTKNSKSNSLSRPDIVIKNLTFGFDDEIFNDESLVIPFGSKVLITGPSGSGKTTLLNLIQGNIEPVSGELFFKDAEGEKYSQYQSVSRIQQEPYYFEISLRDNILMGLENNAKIEQKLYLILKELGLLSELGEHCFDNNYGEEGNKLSGGQKQRVELARAIIHDRKILLVDEGTSSVDKLSSKRIRKLLHNLDATVIEVAHHYDESEVQQLYTHRLEILDKKINFYEV